jgi:hypothetical protein
MNGGAAENGSISIFQGIARYQQIGAQDKGLQDLYYVIDGLEGSIFEGLLVITKQICIVKQLKQCHRMQIATTSNTQFRHINRQTQRVLHAKPAYRSIFNNSIPSERYAFY